MHTVRHSPRDLGWRELQQHVAEQLWHRGDKCACSAQHGSIASILAVPNLGVLEYLLDAFLLQSIAFRTCLALSFSLVALVYFPDVCVPWADVRQALQQTP